MSVASTAQAKRLFSRDGRTVSRRCVRHSLAAGGQSILSDLEFDGRTPSHRAPLTRAYLCVTVWEVQVQFHRSALKHGVDPDETLYAWAAGEERAAWLDDDQPRRLLRVGPDRSGRPLELVALIFDDNRALIIHSMPARRRALDATEGRHR